MNIKDLKEDLPIDHALLKQIYKDIILKLYENVLDGSADIKEITLLISEIKRHETDVLDDVAEDIISFTKSSNGKEIIDLKTEIDLRKQG